MDEHTQDRFELFTYDRTMNLVKWLWEGKVRELHRLPNLLKEKVKDSILVARTN